MTRVYPFVKEKGARLLGPNCPGAHHAGRDPRSASSPAASARPGSVGVVSAARGTLTYEVVYQLTRAGIGQTHLRRHRRRSRSTARTSSTASRRSRRIPKPKAVAMMGEIGGTDEQDAARVREGAHEEAGRRLHRRPDRAAGPAHGARRRDHLRLLGHRRGEDRRLRGRRASASCAGRWTSSSFCRPGC